jgi:DNA-packaging protein gp3
MAKDPEAKKPRGIPKSIPTPELMREHFDNYKRDIKANPFIVEDWVGGMAKKVERRKEKPLTMEGFETWLYHHNIISDVSDYFENKDGRYSDFLHICRAIKREIRQDQIAGGMAGIYNPSITQRLNNLVEKQEVVNKTINVIVPDDDDQ